nr:D-alanyl-D-alanine carboxypeptidase/D-alanyl-D-alanine-endopeptidase [Paramuribaculum sp.]
NLLTGDVIADVNGDLPLIPASVTKLVSVATVLENTPKDYCYSTKAFVTGDVHNRVLSGDLIIQSSGDPTLESACFPEYCGFVDSVVSVVKGLGIDVFKGKIRIEYDKSLEELTPKGWMDSDLPWVYGTGYHAVNFKDNGFVLSLPDKKASPLVPGLNIVMCKNKGRIDYSRARGGKTITVSGRIPKRGVRERLANPDPEGSLMAEIEQKLKEQNIIFESENSCDRNRKLVYEHFSAPLIDILRSTMYRSDNMMAEAALKLSAPGLSRAEAAAKELDLWRNRGVDCQGICIEDGSGLSRNNRMSAYFIADILVWKGCENLDFDYVGLFPRCGQHGTVRNLLKDTPLQGKIALKSGSMSGVRCYAGYALSEDGLPTHAIVIMVNDFKGSMAKLKKEIESLLLEKIS